MNALKLQTTERTRKFGFDAKFLLPKLHKYCISAKNNVCS